MSLNKKRLLAALYFGNRIIQGHFPLRAFIAPNMGNPFRGAHSFSSVNAPYLHGISHPSLLTRRMPPPLLSYHGSALSSPKDKCQHSHGNKRRDDGNGYDIADRPAGFPDCPVCNSFSLVAGH